MTDEFPRDAIVCKLSEGLLKLYVPNLTVVQGKLTELTRKQEVVYRELHDENLKLCSVFYDPDLCEMLAKAKAARDKLTAVKKKMTQIHEKTVKLKKIALKLEENKQQEAAERAHQREMEEQLIGKPQQQ